MMHGERIWSPYAAFARSPVRQRRGGTPAEADDETAAIPVATDDGGTGRAGRWKHNDARSASDEDERAMQEQRRGGFCTVCFIVKRER